MGDINLKQRLHYVTDLSMKGDDSFFAWIKMRDRHGVALETDRVVDLCSFFQNMTLASSLQHARNAVFELVFVLT